MSFRDARSAFSTVVGRIAAGGLALGLVSVPAPVRAECPIAAEDFIPDPDFTTRLGLERCSFATRGVNPYFVLLPGYRLELESDEEVALITVLDQTNVVDGVPTRVVEELSFEKDGDGERTLVERSLNYFAVCRETNSVIYFGEEVEFFDEDGNLIGSEGAWLAGRNGARPGIVMPGTVLLGARYYEEVAPEDSALDKGEIVDIADGCEVDGADERTCVTTLGSNDCNDDQDMKSYAAGIGIVTDDDLELVSFGFVPDDERRPVFPRRRLPRLRR